MKMRINVNARFCTQALTGVQRYSYEITRRLSNRRALTPALPRPEYAGLAAEITPAHGMTPGGHFWEQIQLPRVLGRTDLLWSPVGIGPVMHARQVVTIHDLAHITHPEWYNNRFAAWYKFILPILLRRVCRIIAVSQKTKDEICSVYGIAGEKVVVVNEGVSESFVPLRRNIIEDNLYAYGIHAGSYFLCLGANSPRKNTKRVIAAWNVCRDRMPGASLVIVTRSRQRSTADNMLEPADGDFKILYDVPDSELPMLYGGAIALVYPSLHEGFGLPILEAMACGVPVITSPQVGLFAHIKDAVCVVNPIDERSIAAAMLALYGNCALRNEYISRGSGISRQFSWDHVAKQVEEILVAESE